MLKLLIQYKYTPDSSLHCIFCHSNMYGINQLILTGQLLLCGKKKNF